MSVHRKALFRKQIKAITALSKVRIRTTLQACCSLLDPVRIVHGDFGLMRRFIRVTALENQLKVSDVKQK